MTTIYSVQPEAENELLSHHSSLSKALKSVTDYVNSTRSIGQMIKQTDLHTFTQPNIVGTNVYTMDNKHRVAVITKIFVF
jgi:hypothetical protein